jgi:hypothetical protein
MDIKVLEVALAEELEHGMRHPDEHDLPAELDEARARVRGVADDQVTEADIYEGN